MRRRVALAVLAAVLGAALAAQAQIHGTPPSVTSLGGGKTFFNPPGVPASVTSLGPNGFGPPRFSTVITFGHPARNFVGVRPFRHHFFGPSIFPVYVPYYPYADLPLYQQQPQPPIVIVVDRDGARSAESDDSRYGEHRFGEDHQAYSQPEPKQALAAAPAAPEEQDPTVLVFRDGHRHEVRNYAIVGAILYSFDAKGRRKIPLEELDLEATRKVNDERGVDFILPKS